MARKESMAAIDLALNPPPKTPLALPASVPLVTPSQPAEADDERQPEQQRLQGESIEQPGQKQQGQQSQIEKGFDQIRQNIGKIWDGTKGKLEGIPTPGSLLFPLIILLVFFLLLIPVNGHTRLVWIWLVLTGNAEISGSALSNPNVGGVAGGTFGTSTPQIQTQNGTNGTLPPLAPFVLPSLGTFMTGVQEPL